MIKTTIPTIRLYLLSLALILFNLQRSTAQTPISLVPLSSATHTAVASGNWSSTSTWGGSVPNNGAKVVIPTGITVTIDGIIAERIKTIRIDGELDFNTSVNTELMVETMISTSTGKLEIGNQTNPIASNVSAKLLFIDDGPIDMTWDPKRYSRGAVLMGPVEMYGEQKTSWRALSNQPGAGVSGLILAKTPLNWKAGDKLIVAGTNPNSHTSDEVATIQSVNGSSVTLASALTKNHLGPVSDVVVHVANPSRNIFISSENKSQIKQRGHIMFMHNLNVNINYVEFNGLGRTNKRISLDDTEFPDL